MFLKKNGDVYNTDSLKNRAQGIKNLDLLKILK